MTVAEGTNWLLMPFSDARLAWTGRVIVLSSVASLLPASGERVDRGDRGEVGDDGVLRMSGSYRYVKRGRFGYDPSGL